MTGFLDAPAVAALLGGIIGLAGSLGATMIAGWNQRRERVAAFEQSRRGLVDERRWSTFVDIMASSNRLSAKAGEMLATADPTRHQELVSEIASEYERFLECMSPAFVVAGLGDVHEALATLTKATRELAYASRKAHPFGIDVPELLDRQRLAIRSLEGELRLVFGYAETGIAKSA